MVPEEVAAAQALLERMREKTAAAGRPGGKAQSRPSSARPGHTQVDATACAELRAVVEEVLWVALLQVRSCPRPPVAGCSGNVADGGAGTADAGLEERLGSLMLSAVGPALRPVARRVLAPGQGLVRRIRCEFPRLAMHLGFRESEDVEPPTIPWTSQELATRIEEVRACRDRLLAMDITKTMISRLGQ